MLEHTPVMMSEVLEALAPKAGEVHVDCTFGRGGYSRAILERGAQVIGIDQDPSVARYAQELKGEYGESFTFYEGNFDQIAHILEGRKVDGLVLDLGVSSMQLDQAERGFSFLRDAPLDMRMSSEGITAADFIADTAEEELARVIFEYGDERASRKIARFIVEARERAPIRTTLELASIVRRAIRFRPGKIDCATKTFQAIRIWINDELGSLERLLAEAIDILKDGGRLVVVTFHSLEDRMVKQYLQDNTEKRVQRSKYAKRQQGSSPFALLFKKAVKPSSAEIKENPRARSAKMRGAVRTVTSTNMEVL